MHARIAAIKNTFLRRSYEADHVQRVSEEALYSISAWLTVSDIIAKIDLPTYEWAVKKMEKNYAHASKKVCRARTSLHAIEVKIAGLEDQLAASSSNPRNIKSIEKKIKALRAKEFKAMAKYKLRMAQLDKASDSLMSATTMCDRAKAATEWLATFAATDASATTTTTSTTAPTASNTPSARRSMIDRIKSGAPCLLRMVAAHCDDLLTAICTALLATDSLLTPPPRSAELRDGNTCTRDAVSRDTRGRGTGARLATPRSSSTTKVV
nr:hypothetical protein HK105_002350 [Polyrhizophydium stewartii]